MADNTTTPIADGTIIATDDVGGAHYQRVKPAFGVEGSAVDVSATNPLPVTIGAGPFAITGGLTDAELRASAVPVSLSGSVAVTGPLTDTQLRATAVPVSGPLTDAELRASALPVSAASLPLPSGAATSALQTTLNTSVGNLLTEATFTTRQPTTGPKAASGSVPMVLSNDQDPVFDHANGAKFTVTTASQTAITPPAGARYLRVHATADMFIRTDGGVAADAAGSIILKAGVTETIPCVGGTAVTAIVASGTATLYATPSKSRT